MRSIGLNVTTPPTGPFNTVSDVEFMGDKLYASVKGAIDGSHPGYLVAWDVLPGNAGLSSSTQTIIATSGLLPWSLTPVPGREAILASDPAIGALLICLGIAVLMIAAGALVFDLSRVNAAANTTTINSLVIPPGPAQLTTGFQAVCWSEYSPRTGTYLIVDAYGTVTEVALSRSLTPTIVKVRRTCVPAGRELIAAIAISAPRWNERPGCCHRACWDSRVRTVCVHSQNSSQHQSRFFYILSAESASVTALRLIPGGQSVVSGQYEFGASAAALGIHTCEQLVFQGLSSEC